LFDDDFLAGVNGVARRLNFIGMVIMILLLQIDFKYGSCCHKKDDPRNIYPHYNVFLLN
jgi:hypothetical protein